MSKQVIVEYESADGTLQLALVEPTGRFERAASASNPEKHWQFEAVDTRDGKVKSYALADIRQWIEGQACTVVMRNKRGVALEAA